MNATGTIFKDLGKDGGSIHRDVESISNAGKAAVPIPGIDGRQQKVEADTGMGWKTGQSERGFCFRHNAIHIVRGEYDRAFEALLPALELEEDQILSGLWVEIFQQLAWCYYDLGAYDRALEHCQKAISCQHYINSTGRSPAFALLALLQIHLGNLNEAVEAVIKGWENFDLEWQTYSGWWETISILQAEAELALAQGELIRAARCIEQLLGKYDELKLCHLKPGILFLQARVELAAGMKENAYQTLTNALALSNEMGTHRDVWAMSSALSELEIERGCESAATQLKERACQEVMFIAEHAGTSELSEIFLHHRVCS